MPLASVARQPLGLHAGLRHRLAHVLDARRLPRLRREVAAHAVPRVPEVLAARGLVSPSRPGRRRAGARSDLAGGGVTARPRLTRRAPTRLCCRAGYAPVIA